MMLVVVKKTGSSQNFMGFFQVMGSTFSKETGLKMTFFQMDSSSNAEIELDV